MKSFSLIQVTKIAAVLICVFVFASCASRMPFVDKKTEAMNVKLEGLVALPSSGKSTTKDIRADVVDTLMSPEDAATLKKHIKNLSDGSEANWANKTTGNVFTVRAIEPRPTTEYGSRKIIVWGRHKGASETMVQTYRYHY